MSAKQKIGWATMKVLLLLLLPAPRASALDWPHWRAPQMNGISQEVGWEAPVDGDAVRVRWSKELGVGYSSVSVAKGRVYTAGWENGRETLHCLSADDGATLWYHSYGATRYNRMHEGGSGGTPAVGDGRVVHMNRDGTVFCVQSESGTILWQKHLADELDVGAPEFGFAGSAVIDDGSIYLDLGRIVKLDLDDGHIRWKTKNYGPAYSTPVPFKRGADTALACFPEHGLVILDAGSGRERASHRWKTKHGINAATPVVEGNRFFISSGYGTGGSVLEWKQGKLNVVWQNREMQNHMATCVLIDGTLYGFDESVLKCIDFATGGRLWAKRGLGKGSLSAADGRLIILSEPGELVVARAAKDAFTEIGRARALDGGQNWTVPVLVDGRIYLRSASGKLACVDVRAQ
jgi:outer membrane protein assembly factor BamB